MPNYNVPAYVAATVRALTADTCHTEWPYKTRRGRMSRPAVWHPVEKKMVMTVYMAFEVLHGRPPTQQLNHTCHNAQCWNPHHVYDGTQLENMRDMIVAGRGDPFVRGHRRTTGENNVHVKLTEQDVLAIRAAWTGDYRQYRTLADVYGVHHSTIGNIILRKTWKHI